MAKLISECSIFPLTVGFWSSFHNCLNKGRKEGLPGSRPPPISPIRVPIHDEKQSQQIRMHYFLLRRETGAQRHEELPTKRLPACSSSKPSPQLYGQNCSLGGWVLHPGQDNAHVVTWAWLRAWQLWGETVSRLVPVADRARRLAAVVLRSPLLVD